MDDPQQASPTSERIWQWVRRRPLPAMGAALLAVVGLVLLYWAFLPYRAPADIGFVYYDADTGRLLHRTLWDWLGLLIIPAVLAVAVYWLNRSQKATELKIAEKARETERRIADSRQKQATLEAYYDRMTELLLEHKLRESPQDSEVRSIARARTVAVVKSLNGPRNGQLLQFLKAPRLMEEEAPVIDPKGIDFSVADMSAAFLSEANLCGAFLNGTDLSEANLYKANMSGADLYKADLRGADLYKANLRNAVGWIIDQFDNVYTLEGATMPDGVQLVGEDIKGPTYDEWKAQYQAKQAQPGT